MEPGGGQVIHLVVYEIMGIRKFKLETKSGVYLYVRLHDRGCKRHFICIELANPFFFTRFSTLKRRSLKQIKSWDRPRPTVTRLANL